MQLVRNVFRHDLGRSIGRCPTEHLRTTEHHWSTESRGWNLCSGRARFLGDIHKARGMGLRLISLARGGSGERDALAP